MSTPAQTSRAAWDSIQPDLTALQVEVFIILRDAGPNGLADFEGEERTAMGPSNYRSRRVELERKGVVTKTGEVRRTKSNRAAVVWCIKAET